MDELQNGSLFWFDLIWMPPLGNGKKWSNCLNFGRRDASFFSFFRNCHSFRPRRPAAARLPDLPDPPNEETFFEQNQSEWFKAAPNPSQSKTQLFNDKNHYTYQTIKAISAGGPRIRGNDFVFGATAFFPLSSLFISLSSLSLSLSLSHSPSLSLSRKEMKLVSDLSDVTRRESWVTIFSESRLKMFSLKIFFERFRVRLRWTARVGSIKTLLRLC